MRVLHNLLYFPNFLVLVTALLDIEEATKAGGLLFEPYPGCFLDILLEVCSNNYSSVTSHSYCSYTFKTC